MDGLDPALPAPGPGEPPSSSALIHGCSAGQPKPTSCTPHDDKPPSVPKMHEAGSIQAMELEVAAARAKPGQSSYGVLPSWTKCPPEQQATLAVKRVGAPLKAITVMCSPPPPEHLAVKRMREMNRSQQHGGSKDAKRYKRASQCRSSTGVGPDDGSDSGRPTDREDVAPGTPRRGTIYGVFHPDRYLNGEDCIDYQGNFITRSKFEKLGGSLMAKWYRSIRVVTTDEPLGSWLARRGLPVLKGNPRNRRQAATTSDDNDDGKVGSAIRPKPASGCSRKAPWPADPCSLKPSNDSPTAGDAVTPVTPTPGGRRNAVNGMTAVTALSQVGPGRGSASCESRDTDGEVKPGPAALSPRGCGCGDATAPLLLRVSPAAGDLSSAAASAGSGGAAAIAVRSGSLAPLPVALAPPAHAVDLPLGPGEPAYQPGPGGPKAAGDGTLELSYSGARRRQGAITGAQHASRSSSQVFSEEASQASILPYATAPTTAAADATAAVAGLEGHFLPAAPLLARPPSPASALVFPIELPSKCADGGGSIRSVASAPFPPPLPAAAGAALHSMGGDPQRFAPGIFCSGFDSNGGGPWPPPPPGRHRMPDHADVAVLHRARYWSRYGDTRYAGTGGQATPPPAVVTNDPGRPIGDPSDSVAAVGPASAQVRTNPPGAYNSHLHHTRGSGGGGGSHAAWPRDTAAAAATPWPPQLPGSAAAQRLPPTGAYGTADECIAGGVGRPTSDSFGGGGGSGGFGGSDFDSSGGGGFVCNPGSLSRHQGHHYAHHNAPHGTPKPVWTGQLLGSSGSALLPSRPPFNRIDMIKLELLHGARGGGGGSSSGGAAPGAAGAFTAPAALLAPGGPPQDGHRGRLASPPPSHLLLQSPQLRPLQHTASDSFEARVERLMCGGNGNGGGGSGSSDGCGGGLRLGSCGPWTAASSSALPAPRLNGNCCGGGSGGGGDVGTVATATAATAVNLVSNTHCNMPVRLGQDVGAYQRLPAADQQALKLQDCGAAAGGMAILGWGGGGPMGPGHPFQADQPSSSYGHM